jgi:uncharacterized protein
MNTDRPPLYVRRARGMGRGVFAGRAYRRGEVIEVCPVIPLPAGTVEAALGALGRYLFKWGKAEDRLAVALGYGSLYNHAPDPNARFTPRAVTDDIVFRARRDIAEGEQIFVNYHWDEGDYAAFVQPAGERPATRTSTPAGTGTRATGAPRPLSAGARRPVGPDARAAR